MNTHEKMRRYKNYIFIIAFVLVVATIYTQINFSFIYMNIISQLVYGLTCSFFVLYIDVLLSDNANSKIEKINMLQACIDKYIKTFERNKSFIYIFNSNPYDFEISKDDNNQIYYRLSTFNIINNDLHRIVKFLNEYQQDIEKVMSKPLNKAELNAISTLLCEECEEKFTIEMISNIKISTFKVLAYLEEIDSELTKEKLRFYKTKRRW